MINTRSIMMLIDDMIRRHKHVYAPIVTVVIRAASLYGVIVVFAYLFQIHYAPSTLAGVIILAPYIFIVGLIVILYVYFIASAPGLLAKYLRFLKTMLFCRGEASLYFQPFRQISRCQYSKASWLKSNNAMTLVINPITDIRYTRIDMFIQQAPTTSTILEIIARIAAISMVRAYAL